MMNIDEPNMNPNMFNHDSYALVKRKDWWRRRPYAAQGRPCRQESALHCIEEDLVMKPRTGKQLLAQRSFDTKSYTFLEERN